MIEFCFILLKTVTGPFVEGGERALADAYSAVPDSSIDLVSFSSDKY